MGTPGSKKPRSVQTPKLPTLSPAAKRRPRKTARKTKSEPGDLASTSQATQAIDNVDPNEDVDQKIVRRLTLTREAFDAIRIKAKNIDEASLGSISELPAELDPDSPISIVEKVNQHRRPLSSFMVSTTVHLIIFLLLTILLAPRVEKTPGIEISATVVLADPLEKNPVDDQQDETIKIELPEENQSPEESTFDSTALDTEITLADAQTNVPSPVTNVSDPNPDATIDPLGSVPAQPTGGGLEGRDESTRAQMAAQRGGSTDSEAAVESGLAWIIEHQQEDGSWRLRHIHDACNGQCPNEGSAMSSTAATGLAVMSLLGAGYTHKAGPYQKEVKAGLDFLVMSMRRTKRGGSLMRGERGMYSHAIATIALAEAFAMTQDTDYADATSFARYYIETAQHKKGGWRYNPGNAGDMTVTGWQIMALKSCQLGNSKTPDHVWINAEMFVDSLRTSSGWYGYLHPEEKKPTTTAVAVLMKMYMGADSESSDVSIAADYIADAGPSKTDMYYNYYGTQVMFHRGGKQWKAWNDVQREHLITTQDRSGTHRNGSWYFDDPHGQVGGRLYTTAMAIMTLEVYYRYMPLYDHNVVSDPVLDR